MREEALSVQVPTGLYVDVAAHLRKSGDQRTPDDVVALALKNWLRSSPRRKGAGYQWKELFLPDGTELRMRYRGIFYYAAVQGDQLMYCSDPVSPRGFVLMVTGTVRNPWRDLWIRRSASEVWTRADTWRGTVPWMAGADRRRHLRRWTD
jgi:hypothetical protein